MKIDRFRKLMIALLFFSIHQLHSQPFYYTDGSDKSKFLRINLQNGLKDIFFVDTINPWGTTFGIQRSNGFLSSAITVIWGGRNTSIICI